MVLRVGLTGGIGSGKTTVAGIFEVLGIPVYYADEAAKRLMNENTALKEKIIQHFGEAAYKDGLLNRPYISQQVFQNKEKLELLNSLVHPVTIKDGNDWIQKQTSAYAIKEAALIFESNSQNDLDYVIGVYSPESLRIQRSMKRDNISRDKVLLRMKNQMNEEEKMKRCDFVIYNNEEQAIVPQVLELNRKLLQLAQQ